MQLAQGRCRATRIGRKGGQAATDGTQAVSNVSAVLVPRIPHVDSTTMLIAQLHGAEIGGPRFNVQCQALRHSKPPAGLELAGLGGTQGPPRTCMWLLACASAARIR